MAQYFIPNSVVYVKIKGVDYAYNWHLGDYLEFDFEHPFLTALKSKKGYLQADLLDEKDAKLLLEGGYIFESSENYARFKNELHSQQERKVAKSLNLIVLPAGQACNFACVYCYEDHSVRTRMGSIEKKAITELIKNEYARRDVDHVNISYFGGEPLLNKPFIVDLNGEIIELSGKFGFHFSSSMTTNGYLLDLETVALLSKLELNSYQVTLDGLTKEHDALRPLKNGKGSYEKIARNLHELKESKLDFLIDIRVNFNNSHCSEGYQEKLLNELEYRFSRDSRFRIRFRPIGDYSLLNQRKTFSEGALCGKSVANDAQIRFEEFALTKGLELADINMFSDCGSFACYAGKPNHYVIDKDLQIKMCTVALDVKDNHVGNLSEDGTLTLNNRHKSWLNKFVGSKCDSCFFSIQCASASCPLINMTEKEAHCPPVAGYKHEWTERLINFIESNT